MEKMKFESVNITQNNIEKIAALFPNCVTEIIDEKKSTDEKKIYKKAINFEMLRQMLSEDAVEGKESYEFTWAGKRAAAAEANKPIRMTLRPCKEESVDWETTENLYIEGDNLQVLKLLQESYLGAVKMIYIDPPYNTGNDFIYNDDFKMNKDDYEARIGLYDEADNRQFIANNNTNPRFHSDWCSMIYPRLLLARNLLSDDGIIFISIDDNEQENLKKICDEIFGSNNFLVEMINITGASQNGEGVKIQKNTESCLVYAKNYPMCYPNKVDKADESLRALNDSPTAFITRPEMGYTIYYNPVTNDKKAVKDYDKNKISLNDEKLVYKDDKELISNGYFPIRPGYRNGNLNRWRWGIETFNERIDEIVVKNNNGKYSVYFKQSGYNPPKNILNYIVGTADIKELFDKKIFDFPKSVKMIKYLASIGTDKASVVLDFFSGSATTAHAVMRLNAEDGGHRKFIMVQLPEKTDENSEAYKSGYKNICEIGKERIRRAGNKINAECKSNAEFGMRNAELNSDFGSNSNSENDNSAQNNMSFNKTNPNTENTNSAFRIPNSELNNSAFRIPHSELDKFRIPNSEFDKGFRVFKLDESNMKDVYYSADEYTQDMLENLESNIKDDRTDLDLLFGCILDWGLPLSLPYTSEDIDGCTVHTYNEGDLIACFNENIPESVIKEIAKRQPLRAVFRDSGFTSAPEKINVLEIFKILAPDTRVKVI